MKRLWAFALAALLCLGTLPVASVSAETFLNENDGPLDVSLIAETGFTKILYHTIKLGEDGDRFDYVEEGGQEILFPFTRFSAELSVRDRHTVIFLYQPLKLETQVRFDEARTIDGVTFPADEGVDLTYGFPFYRASYLYDFARSEALELAAGVSLQLRNASIRFVPADGEQTVVSQDLGPVPIIKLRGSYRFRDSVIPGAFVALEADGFYASSAFFNGADYDFTGSIFDVSLRSGFEPTPGLALFASLRSFGGGGGGTRPEDERTVWSQSWSRFTDNFLSTLSLSLGARVR
jgi:hypothetical protein